MNHLEIIRAFVVIAKEGSLVRASEVLALSPSVVTKRLTQLEHLVGHRLIHRSTRRLKLSAEGEHALRHFSGLLDCYDAAIGTVRRGPAALEGTIRIKLPPTLGALHLNSLIREFSQQHPAIDIEVLLIDGPLNPLAEGVDIAITAFPASFDGVLDEFLWPIGRSLVASPSYLARLGSISHPRELEHCCCLVYHPTGPYWSFLNDTGSISVTVKPHLSSNDMSMLLSAAAAGEGIALLSNYLTFDRVNSGDLRYVLRDFPVPDLWAKALVPEERRSLPHIDALLLHIKTGGDVLFQNNMRAYSYGPTNSKER